MGSHRMNVVVTCILAATIFAARIAIAQAPVALLDVGNEGVRDEQRSLGGSAASPWVNAQVAYRFPTNTPNRINNLHVNGQLLYVVPTDWSVTLPVMGNIAPITTELSGLESFSDSTNAKIDALVRSTDGINVGIYPYMYALETKSCDVVVHGAGAYRINGFPEEDGDVNYLEQLRLGLGSEAFIGDENASRLTIGFTGVVTLFSKDDYETIVGERNNSIWSLETEAVVPIGRGFGALLQWIAVDGAPDNSQFSIVYIKEAD